MNKTLTPYYIDTPLVSPASGLTCSEYTLYIYAWKGSKAAPPSEPTYTITKSNPTSSTSTDTVNISRVINDLINFTPVKATSTSLLESNNQIWVKTEVTYITTEPTDATTPQLASTNLFARGYGYGMDGRNPETPVERNLFSGIEFKVSRTSYACIPIDLEDYDYLVNGSLFVVSYPNGEIAEQYDVISTDNSNDTVGYLWIDLSETLDDEYVEIVFNGESAVLLITEECRYTPVDIFFLNKEGQQQSLTFFKSQTEDLTVTSEQFESDRGQPNLGNHQYVKYNVQGKTKFKVNSGFVSEDLNDVFKQLLLSERVWKIENDTFVPLNVNTTSLEYKTRQKDRLINYEITFDYAFNEVNNI